MTSSACFALPSDEAATFRVPVGSMGVGREKKTELTSRAAFRISDVFLAVRQLWEKLRLLPLGNTLRDLGGRSKSPAGFRGI